MAQQETPVDVAARHAADHADVEGRHAADHAEIVAEASGSARGDLRPAQPEHAVLAVRHSAERA
jgi:hypothetical protein